VDECPPYQAGGPKEATRAPQSRTQAESGGQDCSGEKGESAQRGRPQKRQESTSETSVGHAGQAEGRQDKAEERFEEEQEIESGKTQI